MAGPILVTGGNTPASLISDDCTSTTKPIRRNDLPLGLFTQLQKVFVFVLIGIATFHGAQASADPAKVIIPYDYPGKNDTIKDGSLQLGIDKKDTVQRTAPTLEWFGTVSHELPDEPGADLNVQHYKCTQINRRCPAIDADDTASFQRAISIATSRNQASRVYVPSGVYTFSSTIQVDLKDNAGLRLDTAGADSVMFIDKFPATAASFDMFNVRVHGGNSGYRMGGHNGQSMVLGGFQAVQSDRIDGPAGSIVRIVGTGFATDSSILPPFTIHDVYGTGDVLNGYDAWLNGFYVSGVSIQIQNWGIEGPTDPQGSRCGPKATYLGETYISPEINNRSIYKPHSTCMVAGAGVIFDGSDDGSLPASGQISDGNVKGYVAGVAVTGYVQGSGVTGLNTFNDDWGIVLGGGFILEQRGGPTLIASASGKSNYGSVAPTQVISLSSIQPKIRPGMRVVGAFLPQGAVVQSVEGRKLTIRRLAGQPFGFGGSFSEDVKFTDGLVLTTPGSGQTGQEGFSATFACDDWSGCINAGTDPNSFFAMNSVVANGVNIITNDSSPNWIGFVLGHSYAHQIYDNLLLSSGQGNQRFLYAANAISAPSLDVTGNVIASGGNSAPQLNLADYAGARLSDNHVVGSGRLGTDKGCLATWGMNFLNDKPEIGLKDCAYSPATAFRSPVGLPSYRVSRLPSTCSVGDEAFATDGLKPSELAGKGSGVPVVCTMARVGGPLRWWSLYKAAPVED